jgi:integrase
MVEFNDSAVSDKPVKPAGCPLFPHATRRWAKKIRGNTHYFGPWRDLPGALAKYNREREDLEAGRTPTPEAAEGLTMKLLVNKFLTAKRHLVDTSEITERSFCDYHRTCARLIDVFGKNRLVDDLTADDFENLRNKLAKVRGPVALGNEIGRCRVVFKYAVDNRLVDRPIAYGQNFNKPSRKVLRKARAERGPKMFEAAELRRIIGKAGQPLKAMILLGINCGLGQSDVSSLPVSALDLDGGWMNFPRPKTGVARRCPLWKETASALREALARRPKAADTADADLVFITHRGNRFVRTQREVTEGEPDRWTNKDAVSQEFRTLMIELGINGHRGFYCLRRGFETIGGDSLDQVAVDSIMGHARDDMASVYRQRINDDRLMKVVNVVRAWLFPAKRKPR